MRFRGAAGGRSDRLPGERAPAEVLRHGGRGYRNDSVVKAFPSRVTPKSLPHSLDAREFWKQLHIPEVNGGVPSTPAVYENLAVGREFQGFDATWIV